MKKMFRKKLICLLLSLSFSLSPVLSDLVTFSSDSCEWFWGISPFDLGAGISKKKAEDEESSDEEPNDQEPNDEEFDVDDWDLDRKANEAAREAMEAQKEREAEARRKREADIAAKEAKRKREALKYLSEGSFINLCNRLVEKYVFDKSGSKGLPFKDSNLYLEEDTEITVYLAYALYSLADKLLNHIELIDAEDFVYVVKAKEVSQEFLIEKKFYGYLDNDLFLCDFFAETWDSRANKCVANTIFEKLLEFGSKSDPTSSILPSKFINASTKDIKFNDFYGYEVTCCFSDLWLSIMDNFVFDKTEIWGYDDGNKTMAESLLSYDRKNPDECLRHLNINYVRVLHEFAVKLIACDKLYPVFMVPYLIAAIILTSDLAKEHDFDLRDGAIGDLFNTSGDPRNISTLEALKKSIIVLATNGQKLNFICF